MPPYQVRSHSNRLKMGGRLVILFLETLIWLHTSSRAKPKALTMGNRSPLICPPHLTHLTNVTPSLHPPPGSCLTGDWGLPQTLHTWCPLRPLQGLYLPGTVHLQSYMARCLSLCRYLLHCYLIRETFLTTLYQIAAPIASFILIITF